MPDVELWATGYLRTALVARPESYAVARVDNAKASEKVRPYPARQVVVRRDGGPQDGLFDNARLTVRVWADDEQDAADLARLVRALLMVAPGNGPVVRVESSTGPQGVPGDSQPQKFFTADVQTRGSAL
jgi:hypothetical protein